MMIVGSVYGAFGFDGVDLHIVEEESNSIRGRYAEGLAKDYVLIADVKNIERSIVDSVFLVSEIIHPHFFRL